MLLLFQAMSSPAGSPARRPRSPASSLGWYLLFGLLHELSHAFAAWCLGLVDLRAALAGNGWGLQFAMKLAAERRWELPLADDAAGAEWKIAMVRHTGWACSVLLAAAVYAHASKNRGKSFDGPLDHPAVWAAIITALEALSTDLLGLERYILPFFPRAAPSSSGCTRAVTFFCGNFGLILLNPAYTATEEGKKTALDILEKMISVTMVRGAQSGEFCM